jgi:DNA-binding transcriptional MerR regulator
MDALLGIGAFARRSRLSLKALRLYDRVGLLRPAHVGPDNGYRRYREGQLATARLIAALRRLDMPLAQVAEIVAASACGAARPGSGRSRSTSARYRSSSC